MIQPRRDVFASRTATMVLCEHCVAQNIHRHRPVELIVALDGPLEMICEDDRPIRADCFLVPPMRRHALCDYGGRIALIYLDISYRRLSAWKDQPIRSDAGAQDGLRSEIGRFFVSDRSQEDAGHLMDHWLGSWLDERQVGAPCDPRVAAVLSYLDSQQAPLRANRRSLAKLVSLSPTRLAAIFAENTGMSLSRYIVWLRVKIALALVCNGEGITSAAVQAGFSDGAHLTRSCRATYGCAPSAVIGLSIAQVTHASFGEPTAPDQHIHLAPHVCSETLPSRRSRPFPNGSPHVDREPTALVLARNSFAKSTRS